MRNPHVSATTEAAADSRAAGPESTAPRGRLRRGHPQRTRPCLHPRYRKDVVSQDWAERIGSFGDRDDVDEIERWRWTRCSCVSEGFTQVHTLVPLTLS